MRLVLASASPRRAELLRAAALTFETLAVDLDESVRVGEPAAEYVRRLAAEKSAAAMRWLLGPANRLRQGDDGPAKAGHYVLSPARAGHYVQEPVVPHSDIVIVGADTAVVVDGEILGKPRDAGHAEVMLRRLAGRRHDVMSAVSVRTVETELSNVETTAVYFADLSSADASGYVASGEGRDKAGGYAIQGLASRFIVRIDGSYSNVVGLPIACLLELLRKLG